MFNLLLLWRVIRGPQLFKKYDTSKVTIYKPNALERWANKGVMWANLAVLVVYIMTNTYLFLNLLLFGYCENVVIIMYAVLNLIAILVGIMMYVLKGIGRMRNENYMSFFDIFDKKDINNIRLYDFDFKLWPVSFRLNKSQSKLQIGDITRLELPYDENSHPHMFCLRSCLTKIMGFLFAHTCAPDIIYPGSNSTYYLDNVRDIENGRETLVMKYNGKRAKICSIEGNSIDTMHIDRRTPDGSPLGTLVVCCEGRDMYYENGIMYTPIFAGYSVLGWNTPGFANSTGRPFPRQVKNAIEAVMQYAIKMLGYKETQIVLFGWNIGAYSAAWGAVMFPNILSLVLDAPLDDLSQLSPRNPISLEVVYKYFNINLCDVLLEYDGPVHVIRRVYDEVLSFPNSLALYSNRTNFVVFSLITSRYEQFKEHYLLIECLCMEEEDRIHFHQEIEPRDCLTLVSQYMTDYSAPHTAPLPSDLLIKAIDDSVEQEVVQVVVV